MSFTLTEPPTIMRSIETRTAIAEQLTPLLQCTTEIGLAARTAHWNVRGPNFIELHQLFDQIDIKLGEHRDQVGERLKVLGGMPVLSLRAMAASQMYEEMPTTNNPEELVGALLERLMIHDSYVTYAARVAEKMIDLPTMDVLIEQSRTIEQYCYLLGQLLPSSTLATITGNVAAFVKAMPRAFERAKPPKVEEEGTNPTDKGADVATVDPTAADGSDGAA